MSTVSNSVSKEQFIQQVVGKIQPQINSDASVFTRVGCKIADAFSFIADLFTIRALSSANSLAQREIRQELKELVQKVNAGTDYQTQLNKVVALFSARVTTLDPAKTDPQEMASLFNSTMDALSTARRHSIEKVAPEKVAVLTKEINAELGIKELEEVKAPVSTFPYKKVAFAVACGFFVAVAAYYGISSLRGGSLDISMGSCPVNNSGSAKVSALISPKVVPAMSTTCAQETIMREPKILQCFRSNATV